MKKLKRKYKILALLSLITVLSITLGIDSNADDDDLYKDKKLKVVPNTTFGFGEKFDYDVQYGFIKAGDGTIQVMNKPLNIKGRQAYDIRFSVKSTGSIDLFYKVRDSYRSAVDVKGIFPWIFEQRIKEGGYNYYSKVYFDQLGHYVYTQDKKKYEIPPFVFDLISAFYYVRTLDLSTRKPGDLIHLNTFWKDSTFVLSVKIHKKQIVEVPAGKFRCIVVEPVDLQGGLFRNIGEIHIFLTDDERKMPVKVATSIIIGNVSAELTKYSGLRGPLNSKVK